VTDCRPVAKAAEMLETIYGVPISYEDPITVNDSLLEDDTKQVQRTPDPSHRVIVQKMGSLSFTYDMLSSDAPSADLAKQTEAKTELEVKDALTSAIHGYAAAGGITTFKVSEEDGKFYVVPTNFLSKDGKLLPMLPVLDTRITILPKQRNADELIREICQLLTKSSGQQVYVGMHYLNEFKLHKTNVSGSDVSARSLLKQLLAEMGGRMSWSLFYGPGWGYALNIRSWLFTSLR
jgi:hypothetical protein